MSGSAFLEVLTKLLFPSQYQPLWETLPPQIRTGTVIAGAFLLVAITVFIAFVRNAPLGYEDERGYHAGTSGKDR